MKSSNHGPWATRTRERTIEQRYLEWRGQKAFIRPCIAFQRTRNRTRRRRACIYRVSISVTFLSKVDLDFPLFFPFVVLCSLIHEKMNRSEIWEFKFRLGFYYLNFLNFRLFLWILIEAIEGIIKMTIFLFFIAATKKSNHRFYVPCAEFWTNASTWFIKISKIIRPKICNFLDDCWLETGNRL